MAYKTVVSRHGVIAPLLSPTGAVRALWSTAPALRPDLYEGSRTDRSPYPSPAEGITKENSDDPQDKDLPPGTYPLRGDPAAQHEHPDKQDLKPARPGSAPGPDAHPQPDKPYPENRPDYKLYSDTKASASKGDPNQKVYSSDK